MLGIYCLFVFGLLMCFGFCGCFACFVFCHLVACYWFGSSGCVLLLQVCWALCGAFWVAGCLRRFWFVGFGCFLVVLFCV